MLYRNGIEWLFSGTEQRGYSPCGDVRLQMQALLEVCLRVEGSGLHKTIDERHEGQRYNTRIQKGGSH